MLAKERQKKIAKIVRVYTGKTPTVDIGKGMEYTWVYITTPGVTLADTARLEIAALISAEGLCSSFLKPDGSRMPCVAWTRLEEYAASF